MDVLSVKTYGGVIKSTDLEILCESEPTIANKRSPITVIKLRCRRRALQPLSKAFYTTTGAHIRRSLGRHLRYFIAIASEATPITRMQNYFILFYSYFILSYVGNFSRIYKSKVL
ncbi:unnamed protein product [Spodoptera littoralis]|uniref:Uncharacterized protein n=1 Tax=Spodoptera littoralis TaxID=7109 RepID=A0A9P0N9Z0_SPOLI|nr:unnamed protein product [Spodoptera littoralis]CAH1647801.1 unnamed protein product [Spodoptera littoralis]